MLQNAWNVIDLVILSFDLTRLGSYSYGVEKNVRMMLSTRAVRIITLTPEMRSLVLALLKTMPVIASVFGLGKLLIPCNLPLQEIRNIHHIGVYGLASSLGSSIPLLRKLTHGALHALKPHAK